MEKCKAYCYAKDARLEFAWRVYDDPAGCGCICEELKDSTPKNIPGFTFVGEYRSRAEALASI